MVTFLLEVTPPTPTVSALAEALAEAGWQLESQSLPSVSGLKPAGEEPAGVATVAARAVHAGRFVGEWRRLEPRGRLWGFQPVRDLEGESLIRQLLAGAGALDRVWLTPSFLAQAWRRLAGRGNATPGPEYKHELLPLAGVRTDLIYAWCRLPRAGGRGSPAVEKEASWLSSALAGPTQTGTWLTWSDSPAWVQSAGGPLRQGWPLPAALAGFRWRWPSAVSVGETEPGIAQEDQSRWAERWMGLDRTGVIAGPVEPTGFGGILIRAYGNLLAKVEERLRPAGGQLGSGVNASQSAAIAGGSGSSPEEGAGASGNAEEVERVGSVRGRGTPLTALFDPPLADEEYQAIVAELKAGGGSLRLWGRPQAIAAGRVEVEALDLHGRRPVVVDLSSRQLIALFPERACANSVIRIVVHLVQQVRPAGQVFLGDQPFAHLVQQSWGSAGPGGEAPPPVSDGAAAKRWPQEELPRPHATS